MAEKLSVKSLLKTLDEPKSSDSSDHHHHAAGKTLDEQPSSEFSFSGLESSPEEMATLVKQTAKKIGQKSSADALVHKIQDQVNEEAVHVGEDGIQVYFILPAIPAKYEYVHSKIFYFFPKAIFYFSIFHFSFFIFQFLIFNF